MPAARTGAPWRDLPACTAPWQAVCGPFGRWQRCDAWARIPSAPQTRPMRSADQSELNVF
ncbi:transposase [Actinomadura sp. NAK00032]|uniref:transposase n=1 Tax=Actinomadura sp. NAK00032 TaxID=2742128 RepID=UPI001591EB00|nr:transposase [Actinomadura sp. NAK00032]